MSIRAYMLTIILKPSEQKTSVAFDVMQSLKAMRELHEFSSDFILTN